MPDEYNVSVVFNGRNNLSSAASTVTNDLNRVTRGAQDTSREMGGLERNLNRMRQALDLGIASSMINRVNQFSQEFYELGQNVFAAEQTFFALNGGVAESDRLMEMLVTSTGGVVDNLTLMQGANKLMQMGLADSNEEVARLTELAVKLGGAMGNDAGQSVADFAALLANQSIPRLDNFGISSARVRQRIDELLASGQALSREDAFTMAVLEVGTESLNRLGDAAEANVTPLAQFQTRMDNLFQEGAQNFAIGVNAIVGFFDAIGDAAERNRNHVQAIADTLRLIGVEPESVAEAAPFSLLTSFGLQALLGGNEVITATDAQRAAAEDVLRINYQINNAVREGVRWIDAQVDAMRGRQQAAEQTARIEETYNRVAGNIYSAASTQWDTFMQAGASLNYDYQGNLQASIPFFDPAQLEDVQYAVQRINDELAIAQTEFEAGLITQEQVDYFGLILEDAQAIAAEAERAANAYTNMTLPQALLGGTQENELFGGIADQLMAALGDNNLGDDTSQTIQDALDRAAGRATEVTFALRDQVIPMLENFALEEDTDALIRAIQAVEDALRRGRLYGMTDEEIAAILPFTAHMGATMEYDPLSSIGGGTSTALQTLQDASTEADNLTNLLSLMPGPTQAISDAQKLQETMNQIVDREYTITVNLKVNDPLGLVGGSGNFGTGSSFTVEQAVRNNGGQVPGNSGGGRNSHTRTS